MTGRGRGAKKPLQQQQAPAGAAPRAAAPSYAQMGGGPTSAPPPQVVRAPASTPAWGPAPGASSRATHRAPTAQPGEVVKQFQTLNIGAGASGPAAVPRGGNGNGGASAPVGRGSMRGNRAIGDAPSRQLVTRPVTLQTKHGKITNGLKLLVNYFKIQTVPDWVLHQYRVDIAPEEDRTQVRKFLLRTHRDKLGGHLFDGTVLFTGNRLTTQPGESVTLTSKDERSGVIYTLTIKHVGQVAKGDYAYIQVYNLLMRSCLSALELQLLGRDFYDPQARVMIPDHQLELWPGYKTSIRQHEKDILMCVEVTHKVLRMKTANDVLNDCYRQNSNYYKEDFMKEMIGCIVITKYNNKTYRIDDIDWDSNPNHKFKFRDEEITYAQYMSRKYQIEIRDLKQPLLVSKAKARDVRAGMSEIVNLIPEVCYLTGLTDNMRADFRLMQALAQYTRVSPSTRVQKLMAFNNRLQTCERAMDQLRKFDMSLGRGLVEVEGNKLQEEVIQLGKDQKVPAGPSVEWNMNRATLLKPMPLNSWTLIVPMKFKGAAGQFVETLSRSARGLSFPLGPPSVVTLDRDAAGDYARALTTVMAEAQPQLIMCAVPNQRGDRYTAIKKKCCVERPVPTQVILCKNLNDPKKSGPVALKVAVQMNCKIGGAPWTLDNPLKGCMVIGFDVCHDTTNKSKSFGAMVASLNDSFSRYYSCVTPHSDGNELSNNFALNIVKALRKFQEVNGGNLPTRILIYRDGVGEGQIPYVYETELESIKQKLTGVYGSPDFKMVFLIVTKRINTRVFTLKPDNPGAGTIVDNVITDPEKYDFFLIPQSVRQGTVSPVSYNVLYDTVNLPPERLQRMTYKFCHLYYNWSGTVRVPAPCQYAHKLAFLVGQAIHQEPHAQLSDLLYFL
ncbi:piwi-like protein Siwi [Thrips palmi]|uniref:Piwi-like protein Siwi n=1 Tax=Thrips palmi TaxID=161013 RepID=A0A6P8ZP86_THRPL|nr:piwi-like protein Siwi [Thrips palmi]XP_034243670.1 piwi-like protein Siwi [Thrips palmi]